MSQAADERLAGGPDRLYHGDRGGECAWEGSHGCGLRVLQHQPSIKFEDGVRHPATSMVASCKTTAREKRVGPLCFALPPRMLQGEMH